MCPVDGEHDRPGIRRAIDLALGRRRDVCRDVDEELGLHVELRVAKLIEHGFTLEAARAEALRLFGPMDATRDDLVRVATTTGQRMRIRDRIDDLRQDVGYSIRRLRRAPFFSLGVLATLALGVGANATMFGIVDRLLLRPPAHVIEPEHLGLLSVTFRGRSSEFTQRELSYPIYLDLTRATDAFADVATYTPAGLTSGEGADARELRAIRATASYFTALGVKPQVGRFFAPAETEGAPGANVVVLGYGFWQRQFAGRSDIIGSTLELAGAKFTIIGVAPADFTGIEPGEIDAWIPISAGWTPADLEGYQKGRQAYWLFIFARPRPGVSLTAAAERATAAIRAGEVASGISAERIAQRHSRAGFVSARPSDANGSTSDARVALLVAGVSVLVLILACANVANLQLMHAARRQQEIAVRLALGVSRGRLVAQLGLDSLLLALGGGVAALAVVRWGGGIIRRLLLDNDIVGSSVDAHVVIYTAIATLAAGLVTGFWPAIRASQLRLTDALKSGSRSDTGRNSSTRAALLVTQTALATVMLIGTGAFVLSVRRIHRVPLGMDPSHVSVAMLDVEGRTITNQEIGDATRRLETAAQNFPGVIGTATTAYLPFYTSSGVGVTLPGRDTVPVTKDGGPYVNEVGPAFFDVIGTRVLFGRGFTLADREGTAPVAVVNATTAKLWWPGENPIDKCFFIGNESKRCARVVGVVENSRRQQVLEGESVQFFLPMGQGPALATPHFLLIRTAGDASQVTQMLQRHLQQSAPDIPYVNVQPLSDLIDPQTRSWRLGATVFSAFGALALMLASIGLYAALADDVAQRTREIGIRVALGARSRQIAKLIVGRGVGVVGLGFVLGLATVLLTRQLVEPLLYQTRPDAPGVIAAVALALAIGALSSTVIPARRATRVDPGRALSAE
ncbi:MAG TPA: ADOP family duplicated permease [Gemmatimonadaceae bacterium]